MVAGETVLLGIEPSDPSLLDARAKAEATARVRATEATVKQVQASLQRAKESAELAGHDYQRARTLVQQRTMSLSEFDEVEHRERMAQADMRSSEFALAVANFELEQAQAGADSISGADGRACPGCYAVVDFTGQRTGATCPAGERRGRFGRHSTAGNRGLAGHGDGDRCVVQRRGEDPPGAKVIVEQWGGSIPLEGQVRWLSPRPF